MYPYTVVNLAAPHVSASHRGPSVSFIAPRCSVDFQVSQASPPVQSAKIYTLHLRPEESVLRNYLCKQRSAERVLFQICHLVISPFSMARLHVSSVINPPTILIGSTDGGVALQIKTGKVEKTGKASGNRQGHCRVAPPSIDVVPYNRTRRSLGRRLHPPPSPYPQVIGNLDV